jgi:tetratricopeptide (TPR) repeat protein
MRSGPSLKLLAVFTGIAIVLTAALSIGAVAAEQPHAPILIPNVQEPEEMRVAPFPKPNADLTPADRMLGEALNANDRNDIHAMLPAINRVIASYPEYAAGYVFRLGVLCDGSDKDAVLSDVNNAIKFADSSRAFGEKVKDIGSFYGMRAKIEYLKGDYNGAVADLDNAVRADLTKPTDFVNTGGVKPEQTASLCTWTEPAFDALVQRFPQDYRSHLFRGLYFAFFVRFDMTWQKPATEEFGRAAQLNPRSALPPFFTAQLLHNPLVFFHRVNEIGFSDAAREQANREVLPYYDRALAIDPNLIPALKGRAPIYLDLKQYQRAIADYDKIISTDPQDWIDYHDRGLAKMLSGSPYEAISDFTAAIKIEGRELQKSSGYEGRADAYMQTGQWDLAIKDLTTAISLQIGSIVVLGNIKQFRDIYPEYVAASDEAIAQKLNQTFYPNTKFEEQFLTGHPLASTIIPDLYLKRSDAYLKKGDWHRARIDFRRAINGFPIYAPAIQRWREFGQATNTHNYVDLKTFDDVHNGSVKLWIKEANGESDAPGPYKLFRFELNCNAEQIRTLSLAEYDISGNLIRSGEGGRWGGIVPDTLGEILEHGACGR